MARLNANEQGAHVQKLCTLWTHDDNFSKEDVIFNIDRFTELEANLGSLIQVTALKHGTAIRDFESRPSSRRPTRDVPDAVTGSEINGHHHRKRRRANGATTYDESGVLLAGSCETDFDKPYIFKACAMAADLRSKHPNLQVSIAESIAKNFGLRNRMQAVVSMADEDANCASHVEIVFRDEYLARADMWRMSIAELSNRTVYRGQRCLFMNSIKAVVKNVYINGQSTHSGYFSTATKPVFRSESARFVLFIQMSKEMWNFDADGAGEIMFNKVVNGFLPDLFKRWSRIDAKHVVSIILFTRMQYEASEPRISGFGSSTSTTAEDAHARHVRDYYRVVVSNMACGDWISILYQLKKEFRTFLKDVSLVSKPRQADPLSEAKRTEAEAQEMVIAGKPAEAAQGNILEAINLAGAQFAKDYIDRDLVRTGISIVVVTAGTGVFEVDYNLLKLTTDTLIGSGIGIDLVCLSPMPLHSVPLFKYKRPRPPCKSSVDAEDWTANGPLSSSLTDSSDRTPRQHGPAISRPGSVTDEFTQRAAPYTSNLNKLSAQQEWIYAMPHWVDVSFWAGPTDETVALTKPLKKKAEGQRMYKRKGNFALRCKMYELQMMGVLENEFGEISIEILDAASFDRAMKNKQGEFPTLSESTAARSAQLQPLSTSFQTRDQVRDILVSEDERATYTSWMDAYDDDVFEAVVVRQAKQQGSSQKLDVPGRTKDSITPTKYAPLSGSFRSIGKHSTLDDKSISNSRVTDFPMKSMTRATQQESRESKLLGEERGTFSPEATKSDLKSAMEYDGTGSFMDETGNNAEITPADQRLSLVVPETAIRKDLVAVARASDALREHDRAGPGDSHSSNTLRPANWFLRQISFGHKGDIKPDPPSAVATINLTPGRVKPARLTTENNHKGAIAKKLASTRTTSLEQPSAPITIKTAVRAIKSPGSRYEVGSQSPEISRGEQGTAHGALVHLASSIKDPGSTFLYAGSRPVVDALGPRLDLLSTSGGRTGVSRNISPTNKITPWAVLVNPCNPDKNNIDVANQFKRWQHVFPKRLKTVSVKWKSLCSPASVPLTNEYFPTVQQLSTEYNESPYKITRNDDDDLLDTSKTRESLIRELIAFRLSRGFQVLVGRGVADYTGRGEQTIAGIFDPEYMSHDGDTVLLSIGNTIHQLTCIAGGEVEVKRFSRKATASLASSAGAEDSIAYTAYIRTALESSYQNRDVILRSPRKDYNWNFIDTFLAGYHDEFSDILRFWRARFVLIPVGISIGNRRALSTLAEDSEEEIRLEGIRKLTQIWQRHRHVPPAEEHSLQASTNKKAKDQNPLAIEYHTRDPAAIVAASADSSLLGESDSGYRSSLFSTTSNYHAADYDLKKIAEDLQGERGIAIGDRRWHWRLHYNCFLGFDLTSWLLANFKDIDTRDDAVVLGNRLMQQGLFHHVQQRHAFRDGNFFFSIAAEYRAHRSGQRSGWFGLRKPEKLMPTTPSSEGPRSSPLPSRGGATKSEMAETSSTSSEKGSDTTTPNKGGHRRTVYLSHSMRYDVDPRKRSYRPEHISLHYDRIHNPDNCYHIRLDWMNVTAKLIEDAIVSWATSVEKYGLRLVEVPIAEASNIMEHHPFRAPYLVKLAIPPPQTSSELTYDSSHFSPRHTKPDQHIYHKALLRRLDYVLDIEAADCFPHDVEVLYSWGKPDYRFTQFIHRSGTLVVQITAKGDFLLLANRLAHDRAKDVGRGRVADTLERKRPSAEKDIARISVKATERAPAHRSPFSSPLARPVQDFSYLHGTVQEDFEKPPATMPNAVAREPEQLRDELEAFCSDIPTLQAFYADALEQVNPSPSPHITAVPENIIPTLGLPSAISIQRASLADGRGFLAGSTATGPVVTDGKMADGIVEPSNAPFIASGRHSTLLGDITLSPTQNSQNSAGAEG